MDKATRALIDDLAAATTTVFTDVETYLLEYLSWLVSRDRTVWDVDADRLTLIRDLHRETRTMVDNLHATAPQLATQVVTAAAEHGAAGIRRELLATHPHLTQGSALDTAHLYAIQATATDLVSRFNHVTNRILRFPADVHRRFDATIVAEKLTGQQHTIEFQREALADWYARGIPNFVDVSGRRWSTGAYVEMATRTGVQRALTEGRRAQALQSGFKLGLIQEIPGCCDRCAQWAGAVVALDSSIAIGTHSLRSAVDGVPVRVEVRATVDQARSEGWQHPNCRGNLAVFVPGATDPADHHVEYDADRYEAEQALREQEREIRAAKRRLAVNPNDVAARRDLNQARAKARALVADFDIPRRPARESLAWTQPRGQRRRAPARPDLTKLLGETTPTKPPTRTIIREFRRGDRPPGAVHYNPAEFDATNQKRPKPHELAAFREFAALGFEARVLPNPHDKKSQDVFVTGIGIVEFKSVQVTTKNVDRGLRIAGHQDAESVVVYVRDGARPDLESELTRVIEFAKTKPERSINKLKHVAVLYPDRLRFVKGGWDDPNRL